MNSLDVVRRLSQGYGLSLDEAHTLASAMLRGEFTPEQCGTALVALHNRGESATEILGFVLALRQHARPLCLYEDSLIDNCGTGGDGGGTFNVSTVSAIVAAAAGCRVAKHCNRAVTSQCGSADLLGALQVRFDGPAEFAVRSLMLAGVAFLFAPYYHPALRDLGDIRRQLAIRTIFNIAGPLANPAGVRRQVVGVFSRPLTRIVVETLQRLGASHCLVVHGEDGTDEITTNGPTHVCELRGGEITEYEISPANFGVGWNDQLEICADNAAANAAIAVDVLRGRRFAGRNAVLMNAGAAIYVAGRAKSLADGADAAARAIDSGAAMATLEKLQNLSGES